MTTLGAVVLLVTFTLPSNGELSVHARVMKPLKPLTAMQHCERARAAYEQDLEPKRRAFCLPI
jgi:hypothetical protein